MSTQYRIHVLGASGSGTSTLARGLASRLALQMFDTDDFYWQPTEPAFTTKRPAAERLGLMEALFLPRADWVLSGSMMGWGDPVIPRLTHVLFLTLPAAQRLARLRARERRRFGNAIDPGGARHAAYRGFLDWAMSYDDPGFAGRSRARQESWLAGLQCPVIHLDASKPASELLQCAVDALDPASASA
ncbi:hypothetical protein ACMU_04255 [Actibacterium mucosum KCTC 23349]|uniref:Adenylate kinase n=1 Tax=Actibacterium mucosum KCTC 23349 TaxID=1454373 RepID=A0A037ZF07_9RHOB|nr:hypothetical protein [Actibacterium mucosum]KAJ54116.1 hypothetical protein ACMU_04255 [Actibacterium mucosum KCTC 23349]